MAPPRKYWWLVLVAVPLMVAVIQFGHNWIGNAKVPAPPGISYVNYGGRQTHIQGDVAFNDVTVILQEARQAAADGELPDAFVRTVQTAMKSIRKGDFEHAIPLLESAAETVPLAALKNNLAAAYIAVGEKDKANALLADVDTVSLQDRIAIQHNRRRLQASPASMLSPWQPTRLPGIVAAVTRCDDQGGMLTLEITYRNAGSDSVYLPISPNGSYLLNEHDGQKWTPAIHSIGHSSNLKPGAEYVSWMKFALDRAPSQTLTAVGDMVQRPFENLTCRMSAR